jgi:hypothetical protein
MKQEARVADSIASTSKHRYDSDDFVTKTDVREQLEKLAKYIAERREAEPDYDLPRPSGWKLMALALTIPDKVGSLYVIDESKEARSLATPQGVILAMGPAAYTDKERFGDPLQPWHIVGDRITWVKYDATMFQLANGQRLAFLTDTQPLSCIDAGWVVAEETKA